MFQATLSNNIGQLETNINTTVMNVTRIFNTTEELIRNITRNSTNTLQEFLDEVSTGSLLCMVVL